MKSNQAFVLAKIALVGVAVSLAVIIGYLVFSDRGPRDSLPVSEGEDDIRQRLDDLSRRNQPFAFKVVDVKEVMHLGSELRIDLQTSNDVARVATEEDLQRLWQAIEPAVNDRRMFLWIRTEVPGALPWGIISKLCYQPWLDAGDAGWEVDFRKLEMGVDAVPCSFVNSIDRTIVGQRCMIVTQPMVNRIDEQLIRRGWKVKHRDVNHYSAEIRDPTVSVVLTPESVKVSTSQIGCDRFRDAVRLVFSELGIAYEVMTEMHSVTGSPEYCADPEGPRRWRWVMRQYDVEYDVIGDATESVDAGYEWTDSIVRR